MAAGLVQAQLNWDGSAASNDAAVEKTLTAVKAHRSLKARQVTSDPDAKAQFTPWYSFDNSQAVSRGCAVSRFSGTPVSDTLIKIKGDLALYPVHVGPPYLYAQLVLDDNGVGGGEWRNGAQPPSVMLKVGIGADPEHLAQSFVYAMPQLQYEPWNGSEIYLGDTAVARVLGKIKLLPGYSLQFRVKYVSATMPLGGDDYAGVTNGYLEAAVVAQECPSSSRARDLIGGIEDGR